MTAPTRIEAPRKHPPAARRFGRYTLLGKLARGGMADVYAAELATGTSAVERVAIKRMQPHLACDPEIVRMFLEEARIGSRLAHPNICQIYELSRAGDEYYIAMEYLHGVPLSRLLSACIQAGREIPVPIVAGIIAQACEGLHYAHELRDADGAPLRVIHRDISPQNLLVCQDGTVKLLDFGIAKAADSEDCTRAGTVKGKERYMSPEQHKGEPLDRRTDIWSLGVVLFESLTGIRLFRHKGLLETAKGVVNDPIPSVWRLRPDVPPAFEPIVARALCRPRQWRFGSAAKLRRALITAMGADGLAPPSAIGALVRDTCGPTLAQRASLFTRVPPTPRGSDSTADPATVTVPGSRHAVTSAMAAVVAAAVAVSLLVRSPSSPGAVETPAPAVAASHPVITDLSREEPAPRATPPTERRVNRPAVRERRRAPRAKRRRPPRSGKLYVDAEPYAVIYVDGKKLGVTPLLGKPIAAGRRTLRAVTADGRVERISIDVDAGETVRRRIRW